MLGVGVGSGGGGMDTVLLYCVVYLDNYDVPGHARPCSNEACRAAIAYIYCEMYTSSNYYAAAGLRLRPPRIAWPEGIVTVVCTAL